MHDAKNESKNDWSALSENLESAFLVAYRYLNEFISGSKNSLRSKTVYRYAALSSALIVLLISTTSFGQNVPGDDGDLDEISKHLKPFETLAKECKKDECPEIDCQESQKAFIALRDSREYVRSMDYWLNRAKIDYREHFDAQVAANKITKESIERIEKAIDAQEFLIDVENFIADVFSASVNLKDLLNDSKRLKELSVLEYLDKVDTLYEFTKDLDDAVKIARKRGGSETTIKGLEQLSLGTKELDSVKSSLTNVKTLIQEARKKGLDWRKIARSPKGSAAIISLAVRLGAAYASMELEERKARHRTLLAELNASKLAMDKAFAEYIRINERASKARHLFLRFERLIVIDRTNGTGTLTLCFLRTGKKCPLMDLSYTSRLKFPDFAVFDDYNVPTDIGPKKRSWNTAMSYFNVAVLVVPDLLKDVPGLTSLQPGLTIEKSSFKPGDVIKAKFTAPSCYPYESWVGIVPGAANHGSESLNASVVLPYKSLLRNRKTGEMLFIAPKKPGKYDLRMNDTGTGNEVKHVTFTVKNGDRSEYDLLMSVEAKEKWQKSGIKVQAGDFVKISTSGSVQYTPRKNAINGGRCGPLGVPGFESYSVKKEWNHCAVIAKIGEQVVLIGDSGFFKVDFAGELLLRINDNDTGNNAGAFDAYITVIRSQK